MKLIIGLGNPGVKYQNNRHNIGHMFVDYLEMSLRKSPTGRTKQSISPKPQLT